MNFSNYGVRYSFIEHEKDRDFYSIHTTNKSIAIDKKGIDTYLLLSELIRSKKCELENFNNNLGNNEIRLKDTMNAFLGAGLFYIRENEKSISGTEFIDSYFSEVISLWLTEAFSHPFWDRMLTGKGSKELFSGWLFELYHYTKNCNRHMPLVCAYTENKKIKQELVKHYVEEWPHYHYFRKSLEAMGFSKEDIENSEPLPMTLEMSNFMRQAARKNVLCYSICSAVLEGTTIDSDNYDSYYSKCKDLYNLPDNAIKPIYDHLALDKQYEHSNLFGTILSHVDDITPKQASDILEYGHQMTEHIWIWTNEIEQYYANNTNDVPRSRFSYEIF